MPVDYFFRPYAFDVSEVEISFRKKASIGAKDQTILKIKIQDEVERFIDIENILGIESRMSRINVPIQISHPMQMTMLAREVRRTWGLGITERRRFTHMHELAHLLANSSFEEGLSNHDKEKLCDAFASEMLLPTEVIEFEFGSKSKISVQEVIRIQKIYGVSIDAIVYSFKRLGIFNENRHRSYCIKKSTNPKFKKYVEESRYIESSSDQNYDDEFYEGLVYSVLAQELISTTKAAQLLRTSIQDVESKLHTF